MTSEGRNQFQFDWPVFPRYDLITNEDDEWSCSGELNSDAKWANWPGPWLARPVLALPKTLYAPLVDRVGLHRAFADLPIVYDDRTQAVAPKRYLAFADRHGFLTRGVSLTGTARGGETAGQRHGVGESVWFWDKEIRLIRRALRIWEPLATNNKARLGQLIVWSDTKEVRFAEEERWIIGFVEPDYTSPIANARTSPELIASWPGFDLEGPARHVLIQQINQAIADQVSIHLEDSSPPRVAFKPDTLLAAMWVMLLLEVAGGQVVRQCEGCQEWFDATDRRRDARYCGDGSRCRVRAHRRSARAQHPR